MSVDKPVIAPSGSSSQDEMSGVDGVSESSPSLSCKKLLWPHKSQAESGSCPASLQWEGTACVHWCVPGRSDTAKKTGILESDKDSSNSIYVYFQIMFQTVGLA